MHDIYSPALERKAPEPPAYASTELLVVSVARIAAQADGGFADVVAWGRDPLKWWLRRGDQTPILGALSAQCRERLAEHLHRLGSRPCLEALIEVADGADLDGVLTRYSRLDPDIVKALRGDRFPPLPIHEVPS